MEAATPACRLTELLTRASGPLHADAEACLSCQGRVPGTCVRASVDLKVSCEGSSLLVPYDCRGKSGSDQDQNIIRGAVRGSLLGFGSGRNRKTASSSATQLVFLTNRTRVERCPHLFAIMDRHPCRVEPTVEVEITSNLR